ncbi:luc7-like protein 3 [Convolutriloba macropyga]|uniref:luc7-like protein 3 n=1 Tax=Convolutriloba macropyga TaxID=536237 RepID=UPI003F521FEB
MASGFMAQMLDELMGKDRDLLPEEGSRQKGFSDSEVCKYYLCGFCPHDLFTNTKMDMGPCTRIHDDALVESYRNSSRFKKMGYEEDFLRTLQSIQSDCEKRIRRANQRLSQAPNQNLGNPKTSSLQIIESKITTLLEKVETLGSEGKVEEAQILMRQIDQLRKEKENLQSHIMVDNPNEKQMEVCEICGAFLIVGDAQSRVDDHLKGKQHTGFARVRAGIVQLREELYGIKEGDRAPRRRSSSRSNTPPRRRRRSTSSETSSKSRKAKTTDPSDYSEMLQKESEKRNIKPEDIPGPDKPKKNNRSRSRSRSSRRRRDKRSGSRDRNRREKSRSRNRDRSKRSREKRSKSRDRKSSRKESSKKSSRKSSRSRSREKKGRRRHSSNNSGERIEVKIPIKEDDTSR